MDRSLSTGADASGGNEAENGIADVVDTSADLSEAKPTKQVETNNKPPSLKRAKTVQTKLEMPAQTEQDKEVIDVDEMEAAAPASDKPVGGATKSVESAADSQVDSLAVGTTAIAGVKRPPPQGAKKPGPKSKKAAAAGSEKPTKTLDFWSKLKVTTKPEVCVLLCYTSGGAI